MRAILAFLAVVCLISSGFAQGVLPVNMDSTQKNLDISNCNSPEGGPVSQEISVDIDNPMPVQMKVSYQYLDLATNSYEDQPMNTYCYVPSPGTRTCKFKVPIRLGGSGNGTMNNLELLRLTGADAEGKRPATYTASFTFNVKHEETLQETNVFAKIKEAESFMSQSESKIPCLGTVCCGMGGAKEKLEKARQDVISSKEQLQLCDLKSAYSSAASSYANAKNTLTVLNANTEQCNAILLQYKGAKTDVDNADTQLSNMGCTVSATAANQLEQAKTKLRSAASAIASDDYERADLELQDSKRSAASAKISATCESATGNQQTGGQEPQTGGTQQPGTGTSNQQSEPPLCPLGMALIATVVFGAFAYNKK